MELSRKTAILLLLSVVACGRRSTQVVLPPPIPATPGFSETGVASWYGHPYHGRRTSNGEVYDMDKMTAAHLRLPFGTVVRVRNLDNDRSVEVRINDRGPFVKSRILDLSREAARRLEMIGPGTARVRLEVLAAPEARQASTVEPSPPTSTCAQSFTVQLGAFRGRANAEALQQRVADVRPVALRVVEASDAVEPLFRVQTEPSEEFESVRRLREELFADGFDGFIVETRAAALGDCASQ